MNPAQVVGVLDLGGSGLTTAIVGQDLMPHALERREIADLPDYGAIIAATVDRAARLVAAHPAIVAVGVSAAGQVEADAATISHRAIARGQAEGPVAALPVSRYPLGTLIARQTGKPTVVENDGQAATVAEWRAGAGVGLAHLACLTIGTFVGSGVVSEGRLIRRRTSGVLLGGILAPVADSSELRHIGMLVGGHAVESTYGTRMREVLGGDPAPFRSAVEVAAAARDGDPIARAVFADVSAALALLCTNVENEWNPEAIVLAGGLMGAHDLLLTDELRAFIARHRLPGATPAGPSLRLARFGAQAGIVGAAIVAFEHLGLPYATGLVPTVGCSRGE